ncbi:MAG: hypothetical protein V1728_04800 [Candidatus Micrarchaeota archaeon]
MNQDAMARPLKRNLLNTLDPQAKKDVKDIQRMLPLVDIDVIVTIYKKVMDRKIDRLTLDSQAKDDIIYIKKKFPDVRIKVIVAIYKKEIEEIRRTASIPTLDHTLAKKATIDTIERYLDILNKNATVKMIRELMEQEKIMEWAGQELMG